MKLTKMTFRTMALAMMLALPFLANTALAGGPGHKDRLAHYTEALELTPAQAQSMGALLDEMRTNKQSLKALDREERHAAKKELKATFRQDIEALLSAAQLEKFDAMKQAKRKNRAARKQSKEEKPQTL